MSDTRKGADFHVMFPGMEHDECILFIEFVFLKRLQAMPCGSILFKVKEFENLKMIFQTYFQRTIPVGINQLRGKITDGITGLSQKRNIKGSGIFVNEHMRFFRFHFHLTVTTVPEAASENCVPLEGNGFAFFAVSGYTDVQNKKDALVKVAV